VATKAKPTKKRTPDILDQTVVKSDWDKLAAQVKENPVMYGAGAALVALAILAGLIFRVSGTSGARSQMTQLASAVTTDSPALRVTELEPLAEGKGELSPEALYLLGESAFEAKDYGRAREAFERLREEFPDSPYVPNAVEGLGYVSENAERYEEALAAYEEIVEKWPQSFARRRQHLNIARCHERLEAPGEAAAAYQAHLDQFPGTSFEGEARAALDRLKQAHPELLDGPETPRPGGVAESEVSPETGDAAQAADEAGPADAEGVPEAGSSPAPEASPE